MGSLKSNKVCPHDTVTVLSDVPLICESVFASLVSWLQHYGDENPEVIL